MKNELAVLNPSEASMTEENIKNASALLALLHGKSDSICRLFKKEILVKKSDLKSLNDQMVQKLSLHDVQAITTTLDIAFKNKRVMTFKTWDEFEAYDFSQINSATKSLFIQWDFLVKLVGYKIPQRHTVNIRISSTPDPSDVFKVLLSGGFDNSEDFDMQSCTMICKVDFINNKLAEELVNEAEAWNELCECAYSLKGKVRPFLCKHRNLFASSTEIVSLFSLMTLIAVLFKITIRKMAIFITNQHLVYIMLLLVPVLKMARMIGNSFGKKIYDAFGDLMDTHVFEISKGDEKEKKRIEKRSEYGKELFLFIINFVVSFFLSAFFFHLE